MHEQNNQLYLLDMYISRRASRVRNILVSVANGSLTLIILLIAPLGLASVIINTLLVTFSTYFVACLADWVVAWLEPSASANVISNGEAPLRNISHQRQESAFERWRHRQ